MSNQFPGTPDPTSPPAPAAPDAQGAPATASADQSRPFLTPDDLETWWQGKLPEAAESGFRRMQGYIDATQKTIREAVQAHDQFLQSLKASGVQITTEQEKASREQVVQQAQAFAVTPATQPPASEQSDPAVQTALDQMMIDMERKAGISIDSTDEEAKLIKLDGETWEYLTTYQQALDKKRARVLSTSSPATPQGPPRLPTSPASSTPANQLKDLKDQNEIWAFMKRGR